MKPEDMVVHLMHVAEASLEDKTLIVEEGKEDKRIGGYFADLTLLEGAFESMYMWEMMPEAHFKVTIPQEKITLTLNPEPQQKT